MLAEQVVAMADAALAPNPPRAYARGWANFQRWTEANGLTSLPAGPETLAMYLMDRARQVRVSSLEQEIAAIVVAHHKADEHCPTDNHGVHATWRGIRRNHGQPKIGKDPLGVVDLARMVVALGDSPIGLRDRAILPLGFAGALHSSHAGTASTGQVSRRRPFGMPMCWPALSASHFERRMRSA